MRTLAHGGKPMLELIAGAVVVAAGVFVYVERKALLASVESKIANVRSAVKAEVAKVIADAKAEAAALESAVKADVTKAEGSVQNLVAKIEAEIKKAL